MKKPFTLEATLLTLQEQNSRLSERLAKLETWEPPSGGIAMQVVLSNNYAYTTPSTDTLPFDTVYYDTHDAFDAVNYTFVAPSVGRYLAVGRCKSSGGVGVGSLLVQHTTTNYRGYDNYDLAIGSANALMIFEMDAGDTLKCTFIATANTTLIAYGADISLTVEQMA